MTMSWPLSTVGDQFNVQLGKMLDSERNAGVSKVYVGNRAVQWGRVIVAAAGVVPLTTTDLQRFRLKTGDLLVCEGGEVGRAAIWNDELTECYFQKALHRLRPRRDYDPRLMLAFLEYWSSIGGFANYVTQTSIAHLPREKFVQMPLPLPDSAEQRSIGDALETATGLIDSLERLIAKKHDVKHGLMQELLTGRTRLPGFTGGWLEITLGEHVTYVRTVPLSRDQLDQESPLRYIHYGDIHTRSSVLLDAAKESLPRAASHKASRAGRLAPGDLAFADASEDPGGVGKSVEISHVPPEGVVPGLHTIAARFDKSVLADGFKAYIQFIPAFRAALLRLAAGTKVLATTRSYISSVALNLPGAEEQSAIAEALQDADTEIQALERRLESACAVKVGMMQELLRGRTRLPMKEDA